MPHSTSPLALVTALAALALAAGCPRHSTAPSPSSSPPPAALEPSLRSLLVALHDGDLDAVAAAPLAEPFTVDLAPHDQAPRVVVFATRAELVACLSGDCANPAAAALSSGWEIEGDMPTPEQPERQPAVLTCAPDPAQPGVVCCRIDATSMADLALVPSRACARDGRFFSLVVAQDGF